MRIRWLGHASFEIETEGSIIYIDPYALTGEVGKADVVLITHEHFDHCDEDAIKKIEKKDTLLITTDRAAKKLGREARIVGAGEFVLYENILIKTVPAYALKSRHHPKGNGVGYVIEAEGKRIYHAGDTDHIPEMGLIDEVTVAMLPVGGPHTMTIEEAARAVQVIGAETLIPMHYGHFKDSTADTAKLKKIVESSSHTTVEDLTHNREIHV